MAAGYTQAMKALAEIVRAVEHRRSQTPETKALRRVYVGP